jgi:membrane protein YqaA with SNARE-associated domain
MIKTARVFLDKLQTRIETNIDQPWYYFWIAFLAAIDMYVSFIPTDIILFTTIFLRPKKWLGASLAIGIGSVLGGASICFLLNWKHDWVLNTLFPEVFNHPWWLKAESWVSKWGLGAVLITGLGPFPQQFTLIMATLALIPLSQILLWYTVGRIIKFITYGWIASHSPHLFKFIETEWLSFQKTRSLKK